MTDSSNFKCNSLNIDEFSGAAKGNVRNSFSQTFLNFEKTEKKCLAEILQNKPDFYIVLVLLFRHSYSWIVSHSFTLGYCFSHAA